MSRLSWQLVFLLGSARLLAYDSFLHFGRQEEVGGNVESCCGDGRSSPAWELAPGTDARYEVASVALLLAAFRSEQPIFCHPTDSHMARHLVLMQN